MSKIWIKGSERKKLRKGKRESEGISSGCWSFLQSISVFTEILDIGRQVEKDQQEIWIGLLILRRAVALSVCASGFSPVSLSPADMERALPVLFPSTVSLTKLSCTTQLLPGVTSVKPQCLSLLRASAISTQGKPQGENEKEINFYHWKYFPFWPQIEPVPTLTGPPWGLITVAHRRL